MSNTKNETDDVIKQPIVSPLTLKLLKIEKESWGLNKGRYTAKITYTGEKGEITMNVSPEITHDLLRFCGGAIKRFSESAAAELNESINRSIEVSKSETELN